MNEAVPHDYILTTSFRLRLQGKMQVAPEAFAPCLAACAWQKAVEFEKENEI